MYHTSAIDIQYTCSVRGVFIACLFTRGRKMRSTCHVINTFMINSYVCQTFIRELKQRRRRRQRKRHKSWQNGKTTTLRVRHVFLYISLPSLHDYDVKIPNFSFCEGREHGNGFLLLFLNFDTVSEFNSRKNCQDLTNWIRQNKRIKVWNSATSPFKWRFLILNSQPALSCHCQLAIPKGWLLTGDVTRDDSQRRFLAQHSVATLLRHCFESLQQCSNIATLCCVKIVAANCPV